MPFGARTDWTRLSDVVHRLADRRCQGHRQDADDLAQIVMLYLLEQYTGGGNTFLIESSLSRVVRDRDVDGRRRRRTDICESAAHGVDITQVAEDRPDEAETHRAHRRIEGQRRLLVQVAATVLERQLLARIRGSATLAELARDLGDRSPRDVRRLEQQLVKRVAKRVAKRIAKYVAKWLVTTKNSTEKPENHPDRGQNTPPPDG